MKRTILLLLLAGTFFTIFQFSSQNGTDSGTLSRKVMNKIVNVFPYTKDLSNQTKYKIVERSQPIIRKGAHFSIYILVGILIMTFISTYRISLWKKLLCSSGIGFLYAVSDEIHQMYVPGRTARVLDVVIDTAGVWFGIGIVLIIISVWKALTQVGKNANSKCENNLSNT